MTDPDTVGWAYWNDGAGMEWSEQHPIRSGEVPDALDVERMTYAMFCTAYGDEDSAQ